MARVYVSSVAWSAVTAWATGTSYSVGDIRRQLATPSEGSERVFRCTTAGTSGGSEPTWTLTAGGTTTDNDVVWTEITGQAAYNGDGGGTAWGAPHARFRNSIQGGWAVAGDTICLASNHAEANANTKEHQIAGTPASPNLILSVDESVFPATNTTTLKAGATLTFNANGNSSFIGASTSTGVAYFYGITIRQTNTGSLTIILGSTTRSQHFMFDTCVIDNASTGTSNGGMQLYGSPGSSSYIRYRFVNSTFKFAKTNHSIIMEAAVVEITNCTLDAASASPTILFKVGATGMPNARISGCDLAACTGALASALGSGEVTIAQCKLGSGVAVISGSFTAKTLVVRVQNCDSGATNYKDYLAEYAGTIQQEITTVMSGGANDGVTAISWNMTSNANTKMIMPLVSDEFCIRYDTVGTSKTATIEFASSASLTNADIYFVLEYLGSSSVPQSSFVSSRVSGILESGSTYSTSSQSWGGAPAYKQYAQLTFTPQMKGWVKCKAYLVKASATVYVNPVIAIA